MWRISPMRTTTTTAVHQNSSSELQAAGLCASGKLTVAIKLFSSLSSKLEIRVTVSWPGKSTINGVVLKEESVFDDLTLQKGEFQADGTA